MRRLYVLVHYLRGLFRRSSVEDELDEELRFHVERQIEHNVVAGMPPVEARLAAMRELGGLDQIKEGCRDEHRIHWIESLAQDVRFGYRTLKRCPAFTLSALTILAFGVGSSTTIFSVVNGVLLTPLPYRAPERLIRVFGTWEHGSREGISPPDFADYRQRNTVFEGVAAAGNSTPLLNLKAAGDPEQIPSRAVTSGFFATLGITPLLGREFRPEEEAWKGPRVAILSYGLWQRQFGANPSIVGGALTINAVPCTIVGVLPPFFNFLGTAEVFTPMQSSPVPEMRGIRTLIMIGRLKDGIDVRQARDELDRISRALQREQSTFDRGWSATVAPLTEEVIKDFRPALVMLMAAVGFVVLLVSANIASLMLSHAASRRTEISIRLALGASRARIVRQLMTESLMLAFAGGVLGCAIGGWGVQLIKGFGPPTIPRLAAVGIDLRVLAFVFALSAAMGVLFGLEPAWRAGRANLAERMKGGLTRRVAFRDALVLVEVAISVVLVIGAGLLIRSLVRLEGVDPGFRKSHVLTTRIALPGAKFADSSGAKLNAFWRDVVDRLGAIPGVTGAAITSELPLSGLNNPSPRLATTTDGKAYLLYLRSVSPGYARVMQIPLRTGRLFTGDDRQKAPRVAMINEQFQHDVFGDRNPIGQRLTFNFRERAETEDYQATIVGVVGSVRHTSLAAPPFREVYLPVEQSPLFNYDLVLRTDVEPLSIVSAVRQAVWSLDRDQSLGTIRTVDDVVDLGLAQPKFRSYVLGGFAAAALLLTASGLYGLLSFMVAQRNREIGIRVAIGATQKNIVRLILGRGMALTAGGIVIGLVASLGLTRLLSTFIFGIGSTDPVAFGTGSLILVAVALSGCYLPVRRALRIDPVDALRSE